MADQNYEETAFEIYRRRRYRVLALTFNIALSGYPLFMKIFVLTRRKCGRVCHTYQTNYLRLFFMRDFQSYSLFE